MTFPLAATWTGYLDVERLGKCGMKPILTRRMCDYKKGGVSLVVWWCGGVAGVGEN